MGVRFLQINDARVYLDDIVDNRWYGVIGNGHGFDLAAGFPTYDTTGDPTEFTDTVTEAGAGTTIVSNGVTGSGDRLLITNAGNEYDGANVQLKGEGYLLTTDKPIYTQLHHIQQQIPRPAPGEFTLFLLIEELLELPLLKWL